MRKRCTKCEIAPTTPHHNFSGYPTNLNRISLSPSLLSFLNLACSFSFALLLIPFNQSNHLLTDPIKGFRFEIVARLVTLQMGLCFSKRDDGESSYHNMELAGGNVHLITTKQSWDEKLSQASTEGKIVVANFSAAWCGPCRVIAPFYSELSEKYPSLMFLTIDVDELTELSTSWDIKATPTFFFFRDGEQIEKLVGANKPELQKKITAVADSMGKCEK